MQVPLFWIHLRELVESQCGKLFVAPRDNQMKP